jgi:hypothetical protein
MPFSSPMLAKDKSLFNRLGGKKAIAAVVDEFVSSVTGESRPRSLSPHQQPYASGPGIEENRPPRGLRA